MILKKKSPVLITGLFFSIFRRGNWNPFFNKLIIYDLRMVLRRSQLIFRAPNSKVPRVGPDASIEERITYILQSEINPGLAGHGGNCALVEVVEDEEHGLTAVLKFGGGCQGCSAIDVTLKQGVETTLQQHIPELRRVIDQTDHTQAEGAYFK
jgi:Fe/S biogenesis protein NfuA